MAKNNKNFGNKNNGNNKNSNNKNNKNSSFLDRLQRSGVEMTEDYINQNFKAISSNKVENDYIRILRDLAAGNIDVHGDYFQQFIRNPIVFWNFISIMDDKINYYWQIYNAMYYQLSTSQTPMPHDFMEVYTTIYYSYTVYTEMRNHFYTFFNTGDANYFISMSYAVKALFKYI